MRGYDLGMNKIQFSSQLQFGPPKLFILTYHPPWNKGGSLNVEVEVQGSNPTATTYLKYDIGQVSFTQVFYL